MDEQQIKLLTDFVDSFPEQNRKKAAERIKNMDQATRSAFIDDLKKQAPHLEGTEAKPFSVGALVQGLGRGILPGENTLNKAVSGVMAAGEQAREVVTGEEARSYQDVLADNIARTEEFKKNNPNAFGAGELLGFFGMGGAVAKGFGAVAKGLGFAGKTVGSTAALMGAEGAVSGGGIEVAEQIANEGSVTAPSKVLFQTLAGGVFGAALGGGSKAVSNKLRSAVDSRKIKKLKEQAVKELPELKGLMDELDEVVAATTKAERVGEKTADKVLADKASYIVERINDMKSTLQDQVSAGNADFAAKIQDLTNGAIKSLEDSLASGEVSKEVLEKHLIGLGTAFRKSRQTLNRSYGMALDDIVAQHAAKGTKIDVTEAADVIKQSLVDDGILSPNTYEVIEDAIPSDVRGRIAPIINKITKGGTVTFKEANEFKKYVGNIADFTNFDNPATKSYNALRQAMVSADEGVTGAFDGLSSQYSAGRALTDGLRKQAGAYGQTTSLYNAIASDIKDSSKVMGTKVSGRLEQLNDMSFKVFDPSEQAEISTSLRAVKNNIKIAELKDPKKLQTKFNKLARNPDALESANIKDELLQTIADITDLRRANKEIANFEGPAILKRAVNDPTNKEVVAQARQVLSKMSPNSVKEFNMLMSRAAKFNRLKGLPSSKNKVLNELRRNGQQIASDLELAADFIPNFEKLLEEKRLLDIAEQYNLAGRMAGEGGTNVRNVPTDTAGVIGKVLSFLSGAKSDPEVMAAILIKNGIIRNRKQAELAAAKIARHDKLLRNAILLTEGSQRTLEASEGN